MSTPNGTEIIARLTGGEEVNVTEGVQALYDLVIGSMDWGSGFLTVEDAIPVARIAETCGFEGCEKTEVYLRERKREDFRSIRARELRDAGLSGHDSWHQAYDEAKAKFPDPEEL